MESREQAEPVSQIAIQGEPDKVGDMNCDMCHGYHNRIPPGKDDGRYVPRKAIGLGHRKESALVPVRA